MMTSLPRRAGQKLLPLLLVLVAGPLPAQSPQASNWLNLGLKEKDTQQRISYFKKAIELDPRHVEALYQLGIAYKDLQDYRLSEEHLLRALNARPDQTKNETKLQILYELATTYARQGKLADYEQCLRGAKALAILPSTREVILLELGGFYYEQGRYEDALAEFREGQQLNTARAPDFADFVRRLEGELEFHKLYVAAQKAQAQGNLVQAQELLGQLRTQNPGYRDVEVWLTQLGNRVEQEAREKALATAYTEAQALRKSRKLEGAVTAYEHVLALEPAHREARVELQAVRQELQQQRREQQLEIEYTTAVAAAKARDWPRAILALEKILDLDRNYRDARRRLQQAQRALGRENSETVAARYYAEGLAAMNSRDWGAALAAFEKVTKIDPNYRDLARLLAEIENSLAPPVANAESHLAAAMRLDSVYQEARQYLEREEWLPAMIALQRIHVLQPGYRDVDTLLAQARSRLSAGMAHPESTAAVSAPGPQWYTAGGLALLLLMPLLGFVAFAPGTRARFHVLRGNYNQAAQIYEKLLQRHPQRIKVYPALGNLYLILGRKDDNAMRVFKTILQLQLETRNREEINSIVAQQYLLEGRTDSDAIEVLENALQTERSKRRLLGAGLPRA